MLLRLDEAQRLAEELGFVAARKEDGELRIQVCAGVTLMYVNWVDQNDNLIGFEATPWHTHDAVILEVDNGSFLQCDELEILVALGIHELVIVSEYTHGVLHDRWPQHRSEALELKHLKPGTELRVQLAAPKSSGGTRGSRTLA